VAWTAETNIRGPVGPQGERGPEGPPGLSSSVFFYRVDLTSTAPNDPGAGKYKYNNAVMEDVTEIYFDNLTQSGFDASALYKLATLGDQFVLQDKDLAIHHQVWAITGPGVQMMDWFMVPVSFVSSEGQPFDHNREIAAIIRTVSAITEAPMDGKQYGRQNATWTEVVGKIYISDIPPPAAQPGEFWWEDDTGILWLRTEDVDSAQWVQMSGGGGVGVQGPQGAQGEIGPVGPVGPQGPADENSVKHTIQSLTAPQQTQARANINAQQATTFDTSWKPLPLVGTWVEYGSPYSPCGYRKLASGLVVVRGLVRNGSGVICNFPAGYRPSTQGLFNVQCDPNVACRVDLTPEGSLQQVSGSNAWLSLSGVTYFADN